VDLSQRALGAMLGLREAQFSTLLRGREDLPPTLAELLPQVQAALGVTTLREAERVAAANGLGCFARLVRSLEPGIIDIRPQRLALGDVDEVVWVVALSVDREFPAAAVCATALAISVTDERDNWV